MNGLGVNELRIGKLIERIRVQKIDEVILALSTTMEAQTTSHVIPDKLETFKMIFSLILPKINPELI